MKIALLDLRKVVVKRRRMHDHNHFNEKQGVLQKGKETLVRVFCWIAGTLKVGLSLEVHAQPAAACRSK